MRHQIDDGHRGLALDHLRNDVEITGPHKALMLGRVISVLLIAEFLFLQPRVGCHPATLVFLCQFKHAQIESVETGQRDELEFVTHRSQFHLEASNRGIV